MGISSALVFVIAVIISIIVGIVVFHSAIVYTGSGILGFLVSLLLAIVGAWFGYWFIMQLAKSVKS